MRFGEGSFRGSLAASPSSIPSGDALAIGAGLAKG